MCGIAGSYNTPHAPEITKLGLHLLQHRGQEWVGMVSSDGNLFYPERPPLRSEGLVMQILTPKVMRSMMGHMAIGHLRYSTQGASELNNAQPHSAMTSAGQIFFCSNGDIVNCYELRTMLQRNGFMFYSQNDGEVIVKLLAHCYQQNGSWITAIRQAKRMLNGSYSGVLLTRDRIFLIRDPLEMRPFCYTVAPDGAVFFASETSALDIMTADHPSFGDGDYERREVPGSAVLELAEGGVHVHPDARNGEKRAHCVFETIYFSRPESIVFGVQSKAFRRKLGEALVREAQPEGDLVSPVPDSSTEASIAVSQATGIPLEPILYRHHYTGRTFIMPSRTKRDFAVKLKFNPDRRIIRDKRIVLVDDSIVRGTTMDKLIGMIKRYQPAQMTVLITCPLIYHPCYYGIDMKGGLIAAELKGDIDAIKRRVGLEAHDRLHFLSLEGLRSCVERPENWCFGCLDGEYPTDISGYVPPKG